MRFSWLVAVLLAGCIQEFEAPDRADCDLVAPDRVALGEEFAVEVRCAEQTPSWFDFDFGDGEAFVRTSSAVRTHVYGPDMADHLWFSVRVRYIDNAGELQQLESRVERYDPLP